jgi:acetamidase/formamidase
MGMIDLLGRNHNMAASDAYMLCTRRRDHQISEIVDQPTGWSPTTSPARVLDYHTIVS